MARHHPRSRTGGGCSSPQHRPRLSMPGTARWWSSARGDLSSPPVSLRCPVLPDGGGTITAWAGPWPQDVRWWDRTTAARRVTWQVVVEGTTACLVHVEQGAAVVAAIYD